MSNSIFIIVSVRGGIVQEVRTNRAVRVFVEDWDTPNHRPTWDELASSRLSADDQRALSQTDY